MNNMSSLEIEINSEIEATWLLLSIFSKQNWKHGMEKYMSSSKPCLKKPWAGYYWKIGILSIESSVYRNEKLKLPGILWTEYSMMKATYMFLIMTQSTLQVFYTNRYIQEQNVGIGLKKLVFFLKMKLVNFS